MKIRVREGLPFVTITLVYQGKKLDIKEVLIDTGLAGSVFSADKVASIGLVAEPYDPIRQIRGVGGFVSVQVSIRRKGEMGRKERGRGIR
ncbi:MAG: hypothetical protein AB1414_17350 [bacterium]